jgi:hypothetical protein
VESSPQRVEPTEVEPGERQRIAQLIADGKTGAAVEFAKEVHRRRCSPSSEAVLVDTYGARVVSLVDRNLDKEAKALTDLVRERYPSSRGRLGEWNAVVAARHGDLSALLEPLTSAELPSETQLSIYARVRRDVLDLRALAACPALAPEHPLRTAALSLQKAFDAVTSGPVADEALALPEISRQNPLAPWKMLVRAIAAFYRRDDALGEKCVAAIEPDSAAARLAPALLALMHKAPAQAPAVAALVKQVGEGLDPLRAALKRLDNALERRNQQFILQEIRNAVLVCEHADPGLLTRIKQHIAVRAMMAGAKVDKVVAAMNGPSLKNAHFWRLLARAYEEDKGGPGAIPVACSAWEEFRRHAIHEGWFPAKGPEVATLYLHMADLLHRLSAEDLQDVRMRYERFYDGQAESYRGQPAEIRALMPDRHQRHLYFLAPYELFERACEADPCAENFGRWLRHTTEAEPGSSDGVAESWCVALPHDIPPLLHLMQSAEKRNALQKAFKYMERAEQIDGLNADVRRARLRLLVAMAVRHLREKKPHLAEKELRQMEALPQAQQGDRPAFVAALRWVWCNLQLWPGEATAALKETERLMGDPITAHLLIINVENWCGLVGSPALQKPAKATVPFFAAFGRMCALGDDLGMAAPLLDRMPQVIMNELAQPNLKADPRALVAIGEAAMRQDHYPLAYAVSGAGLAQAAESHGRFLFLRARSLPPWEEKRRSSCLAAACELARRHHDSDLLSRIGDFRAELLEWFDAPEAAKAAIGSDEIGRVVQRELEAREFPLSGPPTPYDADEDDEDDGECQCPECSAARGELPAMPPEMIEMLEKMGPDAVAQALAEMLGIGGRKKRGKRRPFLDSGDLPF